MRRYITKVTFTFILFYILVSDFSFAHFGSKGPYGGSVNCMTVYDTTVYFGTFNGGVFESTNSKLTAWRARLVGLTSGKITALVHTGKYLFAATADSGVFIFNGYVGSDRYWRKVNTGLTSLKATSLVAIDSITVMVGTSDKGVFLTTNKGTSWTATNTGLSQLVVNGLEKAGNRIVALTADGVSYFTIGGSSWTEFNDGNTDGLSATLGSFNNASSDLLLLADGKLYVTGSASTQSTAAYTLANNGLPSGTLIRSISNDGANWYIATDNGIYKSSASTISWTSMNTGLSTLETSAIVPFKSQSFICGTLDKGCFKASNPFAAWSSFNNGLNNMRTYSMVTGGDLFVVAATSNGVYVSKDLASSYTLSNKGLIDSLHVNDLAMAAFGLYAATANEGVFFSADSGATWTAINSGLGNLDVKKIFVLGGNKYLIDGDGKVYYSVGSTTSWTSIQTGLPTGVLPNSLTVYGSKLLLSTIGDGVYTRSITSGSWTAVNAGLTNMDVTSVTTSGKKIFAGTDGDGVFVSDTISIQWQTASPNEISHTAMIGLDATRIQAMSSNAGYVFASYHGGVVATSDDGATWIAGGNQFNLPSYTDVNKINFVTTRIFVTTEYNGLYSNALSELPVITNILTTSETNNVNWAYPNPAQNEFSLDLSNVSHKVVEVNIYNSTGKFIESFSGLEEKMNINYPSGMYLLQIRTDDNNVFSQKLIVK